MIRDARVRMFRTDEFGLTTFLIGRDGGVTEIVGVVACRFDRGKSGKELLKRANGGDGNVAGFFFDWGELHTAGKRRASY